MLRGDLEIFRGERGQPAELLIDIAACYGLLNELPLHRLDGGDLDLIDVRRRQSPIALRWGRLAGQLSAGSRQGNRPRF